MRMEFHPDHRDRFLTAQGMSSPLTSQGTISFHRLLRGHVSLRADRRKPLTQTHPSVISQGTLLMSKENQRLKSVISPPTLGH